MTIANIPMVVMLFIFLSAKSSPTIAHVRPRMRFSTDGAACHPDLTCYLFLFSPCSPLLTFMAFTRQAKSRFSQIIFRHKML